MAVGKLNKSFFHPLIDYLKGLVKHGCQLLVFSCQPYFKCYLATCSRNELIKMVKFFKLGNEM